MNSEQLLEIAKIRHQALLRERSSCLYGPRRKKPSWTARLRGWLADAERQAPRPRPEAF